MLFRSILKKEDQVDSMAWILGYDPVDGWNKPPIIPAIEDF